MATKKAAKKAAAKKAAKPAAAAAEVKPAASVQTPPPAADEKTAAPAAASPDPDLGGNETKVATDKVKVSGGTPTPEAAAGNSSEAPDPVIQRREAACDRWARKQGWGTTETGKLVRSVSRLVDKGWVWQNIDGTREFIESEIPTDRTEFEDAVNAVKLSKQEHHQFLWNERLVEV